MKIDTTCADSTSSVSLVSVNVVSVSIVSIADYLRPWKIFSLCCGIAILIIGSYLQPAMDWNIAISIIMAIATYIFSPITTRTIFYKKFRNSLLLWLVAIFGLWFSVDGVYWLYWSIKNPEVIGYMRDANFLPSLCLYLICGFLWLYDGRLIDIFKQFTKSSQCKKS